MTLATLCLLLIGLFFLQGGLHYQTSVQAFNWDLVWRDGLFKQISGFSLLALSLLISIISVRKRLPSVISKWQYSSWRSLHVFSGIALLSLLLTHTGFRPGSNLNFYLMMVFCALMLTGSLLAITVASDHKLSRKLARRLKSVSIWSHILLLWPLPALLGFHMLKTYYF